MPTRVYNIIHGIMGYTSKYLRFCFNWLSMWETRYVKLYGERNIFEILDKLNTSKSYESFTLVTVA